MPYDEDYIDSTYSNEEETPLAPNTGAVSAKKFHFTEGFVYKNFVVMSIAFSGGLGCLSTCLAYSSSELGSSLGGVSNGILYAIYAITALFISKPFVVMIGPKLSLMASLIGICVYVIGFCLAYLFIDESSDLAWMFACTGATVGGFAVGILWTAQGRFFATSAKHYAAARHISVESADANLAAVFASVYLGLEMVMNLVATIFFLSFPSIAGYVIFVIFAGMTFVACLLIMGIDDLQDYGTGIFNYSQISKEAGSMAKMVWMDPKLFLIVPFQVAFGFMISFVNFYIFGTLIGTDDDYGSAYIGLFSAVVVFVGASLSYPATSAANRYGPELLIIIGGLCVSMSGGLLLIFPDNVMASIVALLAYLGIVGFGRMTWENINKAAIANLWVMDQSASTNAFTASTFFTAYAGAMGYFTFPFCDRSGMLWTVCGCGIIGVVCYIAAFRVHAWKRAEMPDNEKKALAHRRFWERIHDHNGGRVTREVSI